MGLVFISRYIDKLNFLRFGRSLCMLQITYIMKKTFLLTLALLTCVLGCWSQNRMPRGPLGNRPGDPRTERQMQRPRMNPELQKLAQTFQTDSLNVGGNEFYYSLKKSEGNNSDAPIVFLYLHGGGGREGKDNVHVQHPAIKNLSEYISENNINAIIVAPLCPKGYYMGKDWSQHHNSP